MAILGEMGSMRGERNVKGVLSYMPQEAWIMSDTVRNNVLFGKEYDEKLYRVVMESCALAKVGLKELLAQYIFCKIISNPKF